MRTNDSGRFLGKVKNYEIDLLNQAASMMADAPDFTFAAPKVLCIIRQTLDMHYAALSLKDDTTGEVAIDMAEGLSGDQISLGHYRLGEGVTGKVAATGESAVVIRMSERPDFLNRISSRASDGDGSFVCVPVLLGKEILGTLSVAGEVKSEDELWDDARLLGVLGSIMAQAIKMRLQAREKQESLLHENERLRGELKSHLGPKNLVGNSREMRIVFDQIAQVAHSPSTVLIHGETGTGKELVAQALHYGGNRADKPFVRVNCAALPETLIESELFGHEKGAFTGAVSSRPGRFEQADGGTIFLDEIGDISPLMQVKLLRVLQEREFERVGGNKTISVDVRVITATHRDLAGMVKQGKFRSDLFYRINVFPVRLPPLRQRTEDIPFLAEHFLKKYAGRAGKAVESISPEAMQILLTHPWPGNVRELENCMEHAVILAGSRVVGPEHLPAIVTAPDTEDSSGANLDYKTRVENFEREILIEALRASRGNVSQAAQRLGATVRVVSYRIRQLGIDVDVVR